MQEDGLEVITIVIIIIVLVCICVACLASVITRLGNQPKKTRSDGCCECGGGGNYRHTETCISEMESTAFGTATVSVPNNLRSRHFDTSIQNV
jgi:hypothetical protein